MDPQTIPSPKKELEKSDNIIGITILFLVLIYTITGFLIQPKAAQSCQSNQNNLQANLNNFCLYNQTNQQKCLKLNNRLTICDPTLINSILQSTSLRGTK